MIMAQLARPVDILMYGMKEFALEDVLTIMQKKMECVFVAKEETA